MYLITYIYNHSRNEMGAKISFPSKFVILFHVILKIYAVYLLYSIKYSNRRATWLDKTLLMCYFQFVIWYIDILGLDVVNVLILFSIVYLVIFSYIENLLVIGFSEEIHNPCSQLHIHFGHSFMTKNIVYLMLSKKINA